MLKVTILLLIFRLALSMAQAAEAPKPDLMEGDGRVSSFYTWAGPIPEMPGTMLRQATLEKTLGLSNAAAQFRILYSSTDGIDGHTPTAVSGLFFTPKGEPPNGGWPLLAWAHETAGMADMCAPSWTGYSVEIEAFLNAWLTHGFAVVATDYQGLGTPGPHPYMAVRPAAYDVLDSIRAVERSFAGLSGKVLLAGYSQGAGAVFGAAALQSTYASNIDIIGTITTGIPYSPQATAAARESTATQVSSTLIYALYIGLLAQQTDPTLKPSDMFSTQALPLFELARRTCVWQLILEVSISGVTRAEGVKPGYHKALDDTAALLEYPSMKLPRPLFIGIGEADRDAPARLELELTKQACVAGTTVEAHLYAGMPHYAAVNRSLPDAIRFAEEMLGGEPISSACSPEAE